MSASEKYFTRSLRSVGLEPVVMTSSYMAPEGYVFDAVVRAWGTTTPLRG